MRVPFTKMHGLGNDFVVFDATSRPLDLTPARIRAIADRHRGIGCDQVLVVSPPPAPDVDFGYRIFNADGSEVAQCGNGARCFARFVTDKQLTRKSVIPVRTDSGRMELEVLEGDQIRVNMGTPIFAPQDIPLVAEAEAARYALDVKGEKVTVGALSMGNPHAVIWLDGPVENAPVATLGPALEHHPRFPQRANIGFAQRLDEHHARLRVHERGAGETQACGSNACAVAADGIRNGVVKSPVTVSLPGGDLTIAWAGGDTPLWMTGPAVSVYEGTWNL